MQWLDGIQFETSDTQRLINGNHLHNYAQLLVYTL
jgi:hypothetical protein